MEFHCRDVSEITAASNCWANSMRPLRDRAFGRSNGAEQLRIRDAAYQVFERPVVARFKFGALKPI